MTKFFTILGGVLLTALLVVLVGVVVYNNVPAVKDWADGWLPAQEQETEDDTNAIMPNPNAQITFDNEFATIVVG